MAIIDNGPTITELFVFVSTDEKGNDGIVANNFGSVMMPLITSREHTADVMKRLAEDIGKKTGTRVRLVKLTALEEVEVICRGKLNA